MSQMRGGGDNGNIYKMHKYAKKDTTLKKKNHILYNISKIHIHFLIEISKIIRFSK